jgi:hypothetical protein
MTLQEAIRIIAEYDGVKIDGDLYWNEDYEIWFHIDLISYSTSADALLPVRIKVIKECSDNWVKFTPEERVTLWGPPYEDMMGSIFDSGQYILSMNYEKACVELAQIIQQLNEKK